MHQEAVEQDTGQDLAGDGQEGDSAMVVARLAVVLPLLQVNNSGIAKLLW